MRFMYDVYEHSLKRRIVELQPKPHWISVCPRHRTRFTGENAISDAPKQAHRG